MQWRKEMMHCQKQEERYKVTISLVASAKKVLPVTAKSKRQALSSPQSSLALSKLGMSGDINVGTYDGWEILLYDSSVLYLFVFVSLVNVIIEGMEVLCYLNKDSLSKIIHANPKSK